MGCGCQKKSKAQKIQQQAQQHKHQVEKSQTAQYIEQMKQTRGKK